MSTYSISKQVNLSFQEAQEKTRQELAKEGFGILTEIDVQSKMKEKIGKDMDNYLILGACNPPLAYQAIQAEYEIGLMLPCNVIVYEKEGQVYVAGIKPSVAMGMINNSRLISLAQEVEARLQRVIDNL